MYFSFFKLSVQFSRSVTSDSLWPHGLQNARLPCPSPTPRAFSNSCPSSRWCHPTISSSVVPFSSCLQSFPASGSFPVSQFFASGGQSVGVSASGSVLYVFMFPYFDCTGSFCWVHGLSCPESCGTDWLVSWSGIELGSPALEGRFLTTGLPGKPQGIFFLDKN